MNTDTMRNRAPWILLLCFLAACRQGPLTPAQYYAYITDPGNGLCTEHVGAEVRIALQYRPPASIVLPFLHGPNEADSVRAFVDEQAGAYHFQVKFQALQEHDVLLAGGAGTAEYYRRQQYFMEGVADDLWLIADGDTLPCAIAHFERTYGAAPFNNLMVSFVGGPEAKPAQELRLFYEDNAFGEGLLELHVSRRALAAIPSLKLS